MPTTTSLTTISSGLVVSSGAILDVLSGGVLVSGFISNGGSAVILSGGVDSSTLILTGGGETISGGGSATGDVISGTQNVASTGTVNSETVGNGGYLDQLSGSVVDNVTISGTGSMTISQAATATNVTLVDGGTIKFLTQANTISGTLTFSGAGTLDAEDLTSKAGAGVQALIVGFSAGDVIELPAGGATLTTTTSGGNTVITATSGAFSDTFAFSGTAIEGNLGSATVSGVEAIVYVAAVSGNVTVSSGITSSNLTVASGATLTVLSGGTASNTSVISGGSATIQSGGTASGTTVAQGGTEFVAGSATGESIAGALTVSGSITGNTIQSGGTLNLSGTAANTVISGGTVNLETVSATLSGSLDFVGSGTLDITGTSSAGAGDQAIISGFYTGDTINLTTFGSGATLSTTTSGGNTVATVTSGGASETLTFASTVGSANLALSSGTNGEALTYSSTSVATTSGYTPGDLVLSIYGDGAGTGYYTLDQAAPIVLEEITQAGTVISQQVLPQATVTVNGVTEYAISGEYQSASEGLLTLAANGQSLTIMGYGVTATAFDAANANSVYGTTALGQTTSLSTATVTAVSRVVADISYNAKVDTSTALYNVFNTNNPRSVYTVNGTTFYISGQGNGADGTEGVFEADDGASSATPIYNSLTDTRQVEIQNGQLYVSIDSSLNGGGGLYSFGSTLPTSATTPTELPGIGVSVTLTSGTANTVNGSYVGSGVNLSPEQYFFANATTLYIADGGVPKVGGMGDGGLQKWSLVNGAWVLDYTLSEGLNLVPSTATTGTTGLIGLTGTVEGNNVILYATNETAAETDQTYLYAITDTLTATTAPTNESFTLLETAAPDTLIRGVSFAPTSASITPQISTTISVTSGVTSAGLTVQSGGDVIVLSGGAVTGMTLLSGGSATISVGATDSGSVIGQGATELVLGSASSDVVEGTQIVSNATAVVSNETIENGGSLDLFLAGVVASGVTVMSGGTLNISGHAIADNVVISGGVVLLDSPKAVLSGSLDFVGGNGTIELAALTTTTAGYGDLAVISGFGATDAIDLRVIGSGATLSTTVSGGNTIATITSGGVSETYILAGSSYASAGFALTGDGSGGMDLTYAPPSLVVSSGVTSSGLSITNSAVISVLSGGAMSAVSILSGGSAVVDGGGTMSDTTIFSGGSATVQLLGIDSGSTISAGGFETVSGSATGDFVYGTQLVSAGTAVVSGETVYNGGTIELFLAGVTAENLTVSSGGTVEINGKAYDYNMVLSSGGLLELQSPKATLSGTLTFAGPATLVDTDLTTPASATIVGEHAVIAGFGAGDAIDFAVLSGTTSVSVVTSGGNTIVTVSASDVTVSGTNSGTGGTMSAIFSGTNYVAGGFSVVTAGGTGTTLTYVPCFRAGTRITTTAGEVAVETLQIGDLVRTAAGEAKPVKWVGQRTLACAKHPRPERVWPVLVQAGAFGTAAPSRDLYLSPDHAVFVDGVLIPVGELVNGCNVRQIKVDTVSYYHVELDLHDVILAEGLPVESFLDSGNRAGFSNGGVALELHPDFTARVWDTACAELVVHGPRLAAVQARLLANATDRVAHRAA